MSQNLPKALGTRGDMLIAYVCDKEASVRVVLNTKQHNFLMYAKKDSNNVCLRQQCIHRVQGRSGPRTCAVLPALVKNQFDFQHKSTHSGSEKSCYQKTFRSQQQGLIRVLRGRTNRENQGVVQTILIYRASGCLNWST